ncbi:2-dehydro-3-deoxygalactonokinase [Vreelandella sp. EE22]
MKDTCEESSCSQRLDWIAVDWGSSNLRVWAMDEDNHVIAQNRSDKGMLALSPAEFEGELFRLVSDWLPERPVTVMICGMAGARQGWQEAAYLTLPASLDRLSHAAVYPRLDDSRLNVALLPGISQRAGQEHGFDVMRGEETQLAGLVAHTPGFTGLACLPGTHSKWAYLEKGALTRFATFLSGELFELLAQRSVLRHSVTTDIDNSACQEAFQTAVQECVKAPEKFSNTLFSLRARDLLDTTLPEHEPRSQLLGARLSGLVIGQELAGAASLMQNDSPVTLIGGQALTRRYALALDAIQQPHTCLDGDAAVLAGLTLTHSTLSLHPRWEIS